MPRYFTKEEAEALLGRIEQLVREAIEFRAEAQSSEQELRSELRRIQTMGGIRVNHTQILGLRARRDAATKIVEDRITRIQETGCQVKDLDIGLIDFPTLFRGNEVLLCWKLGEPNIAWWHGVEEGFKGRKRIDDEFLRQHGNA